MVEAKPVVDAEGILYCGNSPCIFNPGGRGGQHTNGRCGCLEGFSSEWKQAITRSILRMVYKLRKESQEIVICAAIKLPDGRIVRGHRHDSCIRTAIGMVGEVNWKPKMARDQGFITSKNRYVDRKEALCIQKLAGITSICGEYKGELFSEDLY